MQIKIYPGFAFLLLLPSFVCSFLSCSDSDIYETEVLVLGGGTAGTAAAISSARMGIKTLLVSEEVWLGGMLSSAGVSAVDGNTKLPSGFWGEFRDSLITHYGNPEALKTGWVSNHLFEPSVGASIFLNMAKKEPQLKFWTLSRWKNISKHPDGWIVNIHKNNKTIKVIAKEIVDATELGDVAKAVGIPYHIGMDSKSRFGEDIGSELKNDIVQDLTYVMILEEFEEAPVPVKPNDYDPSLFYCATENKKCDKADQMKRVLWPKEKMIQYGKLPNKKYMINWPINGNDFYANVLEMNSEERKKAYEKAKLKSKQFLYYLQTELGFSNLGIAKNEFPTTDGFPLIPYHRESRRIQGLTTLTIQHLSKPYEQSEALYKTGIAVGDYPVDHHHDAHPNAEDLPELYFYPIPSFSVPIGCMIPKDLDHFTVTEKSISVSNIVNGTTRLQPVVLQLGQAAGITAALAARDNSTPQKVSIRAVQTELLNQGGYILPYRDVPKTDPNFKAYQKIGATGILRGEGKNVGWENQSWFYPEKELSPEELYLDDWKHLFPNEFPNAPTVKNILEWFQKSDPQNKLKSFSDLASLQKHFGFSQFHPDSPITRGQFSVILNAFWDPFSRNVDHHGHWID